MKGNGGCESGYGRWEKSRGWGSTWGRDEGGKRADRGRNSVGRRARFRCRAPWRCSAVGSRWRARL